jgi:hypothetical protein
MSLYEKIYNVMNETEGLEKDLTVGSGSNSYKAVGEKEVLNMLKPLFKKHKLIIFPIDGQMTEQNSVFDTSYKGEITTKTRNVTQLIAKFKIVDIESGESEILIGFGNGADSQDKGSGKAFTYAFKTMLSKTFMLFSGEDTDNTHSDDIGNNKQVDKPNISEPQVKRLFTIASKKGYNAESVKKGVLKKYQVTEIAQLTKVQYDEVVAGYEGLADK